MSTKATPPKPAAPVFNAVIGTAGHVDHGKSSLVLALTGVNPDRLKEEQEREITIDLGFAPLTLDNGQRVGIIDVPGHERFVKNMVAGATNIDFVLFVVAADDGVMAQTREHLEILRLLGVKAGLVVLTKIDVAGELAELVKQDIAALVQGTFLEGAPILPVSSKTKAGLPELKAQLERALARIQRRSADGPLRIPIQRVFAKEGFGTVLTGVALSGSVAAGDSVEILPPGFEGRVKGLHAYGQKIEHGRAGHSQALNVAGIERQAVTRGMVLVTPGIFRPTNLVAAQLLHLKGAPFALKHRAPVRFHTGTAEILGKVLVLDGDRIAPGTESFIQVLLDEPTVAVPGDRYILRHESPVVTLGGGQILDNVAVKRKRNDQSVLAELAARFKLLRQPQEFFAHVVAQAAEPKSAKELRAELGLLPAHLASFISAAERSGAVVALTPESLIDAKRFATLSATLVDLIERYLKEHPALAGIERPELQRRLELALKGRQLAPHLDALIAVLEKQGRLVSAANLVRIAGRDRKLDARSEQLAQRIEAELKRGGLAPLSPAEVAAATQTPAKEFKEVLKYLIETGTLVQAAPDFVFHREPFQAAVELVKALFRKSPELTMSEIRQALGMNRKYVVPLIEHFDKLGYTQRAGDKRRWKGK